MKYADTRPYADPEKAARRLLEVANTVEPVQDGRIHLEKINSPFLKKAAARRRGSVRPRNENGASRRCAFGRFQN